MFSDWLKLAWRAYGTRVLSLNAVNKGKQFEEKKIVVSIHEAKVSDHNSFFFL